MPKLSRRAAVAKGALIGALAPRLAMDSAIPDFTAVAQMMAKKGFDRAYVATAIRQATAGVLAADADLDDVKEVIEALAPIIENEEEEEEGGDLDNQEFPMEGETEENGWDRRARDARLRMGRDETPEECTSRERVQAAGDARRKLGHDESEEERTKREEEQKPAMDARMARRRGAHDESEEERKKREAEEEAARANDARLSKTAMDAAIAASVKAAITGQKAIQEAHRVARPWVGDLAMDAACAEDVYQQALKNLGVKVDGVHPSAYRTILEMCPKPGRDAVRGPALAADSAGLRSFEERFPNASKVRLM